MKLQKINVLRVNNLILRGTTIALLLRNPTAYISLPPETHPTHHTSPPHPITRLHPRYLGPTIIIALNGSQDNIVIPGRGGRALGSHQANNETSLRKSWFFFIILTMVFPWKANHNLALTLYGHHWRIISWTHTNKHVWNWNRAIFSWISHEFLIPLHDFIMNLSWFLINFSSLFHDFLRTFNNTFSGDGFY